MPIEQAQLFPFTTDENLLKVLPHARAQKLWSVLEALLRITMLNHRIVQNLHLQEKLETRNKEEIKASLLADSNLYFYELILKQPCFTDANAKFVTFTQIAEAIETAYTTIMTLAAPYHAAEVPASIDVPGIDFSFEAIYERYRRANPDESGEALHAIEYRMLDALSTKWPIPSTVEACNESQREFIVATIKTAYLLLREEYQSIKEEKEGAERIDTRFTKTFVQKLHEKKAFFQEKTGKIEGATSLLLAAHELEEMAKPQAKAFKEDKERVQKNLKNTLLTLPSDQFLSLKAIFPKDRDFDAIVDLIINISLPIHYVDSQNGSHTLLHDAALIFQAMDEAKRKNFEEVVFYFAQHTGYLDRKNSENQTPYEYLKRIFEPVSVEGNAEETFEEAEPLALIEHAFTTEIRRLNNQFVSAQQAKPRHTPQQVTEAFTAVRSKNNIWADVLFGAYVPLDEKETLKQAELAYWQAVINKEMQYLHYQAYTSLSEMLRDMTQLVNRDDPDQMLSSGTRIKLSKRITEISISNLETCLLNNKKDLADKFAFCLKQKVDSEITDPEVKKEINELLQSALEKFNSSSIELPSPSVERIKTIVVLEAKFLRKALEAEVAIPDLEAEVIRLAKILNSCFAVAQQARDRSRRIVLATYQEAQKFWINPTLSPNEIPELMAVASGSVCFSQAEAENNDSTVIVLTEETKALFDVYVPQDVTDPAGKTFLDHALVARNLPLIQSCLRCGARVQEGVDNVVPSPFVSEASANRLLRVGSPLHQAVEAFVKKDAENVRRLMVENNLHLPESQLREQLPWYLYLIRMLLSKVSREEVDAYLENLHRVQAALESARKQVDDTELVRLVEAMVDQVPDSTLKRLGRIRLLEELKKVFYSEIKHNPLARFHNESFERAAVIAYQAYHGASLAAQLAAAEARARVERKAHEQQVAELLAAHERQRAADRAANEQRLQEVQAANEQRLEAVRAEDRAANEQRLEAVRAEDRAAHQRQLEAVRAANEQRLQEVQAAYEQRFAALEQKMVKQRPATASEEGRIRRKKSKAPVTQQRAVEGETAALGPSARDGYWASGGAAANVVAASAVTAAVADNAARLAEGLAPTQTL